MIRKKIYRFILAAALIFTQLPVSTVTAGATQSAAAKYSRTYLLTGNKAADIVTVALAQKEKAKADLGYGEAWCADFISDCAYLAGASDVIPTNGSVAGLYQKILDADGTRVFAPQTGDLVFYYCIKTKTWVHCGIMIDGTRSVEGNYSGKVSLVNGIFRDIHGHTLASGDITRTFIRPSYKKSKTAAPKVISNNPAAGTVTLPDKSNTSAGSDTNDTSKDTTKENTTDSRSADTEKTTTDKSTATKKTTTSKSSSTKKTTTAKSTSVKKTTSSKSTGTKKKTTAKSTGTKKTVTSKSSRKKTTAGKSTSTKKKAASKKKAAKTTTKTKKKFYKKYAGTYQINTNGSMLIMRKKAGKTSDIITTISNGTKVKVKKATGSKKTDWALVTYKYFKGYMSMEFLKKVK